MSFSSILAPVRQSARVVFRPRVHAIRSLHASSSALKKKVVISEDAFEEDEEDDLDLFDTAASSSSTSTPLSHAGQSDVNAQLRRKLIGELSDLAGLPPRKARGKAQQLKLSLINRIVLLSTETEDLEGLKGTLRTWRFLGLEVTDKTVGAIVERCCALGRPEFILELYNEPIQYGIRSISPYHFNKIHRAMVSTPNPPSSLPKLRLPIGSTISNALWHLVALSHIPESEAIEAGGAEPVSTRGKDEETTFQSFVKQLDTAKLDLESESETSRSNKEDMDAALQTEVEKVKGKGGEWAGAVRKIEEIRAGLEKQGDKPRFRIV